MKSLAYIGGPCTWLEAMYTHIYSYNLATCIRCNMTIQSAIAHRPCAACCLSPAISLAALWCAWARPTLLPCRSRRYWLPIRSIVLVESRVPRRFVAPPAAARVVCTRPPRVYGLCTSGFVSDIALGESRVAPRFRTPDARIAARVVCSRPPRIYGLCTSARGFVSNAPSLRALWWWLW